MATQWDVLVIGAGPAGLSAARRAAEAGRRCACIDRLGPGGTLLNIGDLHDAPPGFAARTGADLAAELAEAATNAGLELAFGEVTALRHEGTLWAASTGEEEYTARAVIVATGLSPGTLGLEEESAFEGIGLSHCASCDGPLYSGQDVVVAGDGRWARQEAADLAGIARDVTLVGPDAAALPGVRVIRGRIVGLEGKDGLDAVTIEQEQVRERHPARAVFVQANRRPALDFAPWCARDADGRAIADTALRMNEHGAYAAGDVRSGAPELVASAIADGRRAADSVLRLLDGKEAG